MLKSLSRQDVPIIKNLPRKIERSTPVYPMRIPRKATPMYYENRVLPKLLSRQVLQLTKFDYRLSNRVEHDLQKLRCLVNYHALHFTQPIATLGETVVERMRQLVGDTLRFISDMNPTCWHFLAAIMVEEKRGEKSWVLFERAGRRYMYGLLKTLIKREETAYVPLTPTEVGLMLRALGFGEDVHLYVASGDAYGG